MVAAGGLELNGGCAFGFYGDDHRAPSARGLDGGGEFALAHAEAEVYGLAAGKGAGPGIRGRGGAGHPADCGAKVGGQGAR